MDTGRVPGVAAARQSLYREVEYIVGMWQKVYSTVYSQAVTHPSTNTAQPCLTSVIGRELVYSR